VTLAIPTIFLALPLLATGVVRRGRLAVGARLYRRYGGD
jgi:hypothetical protein